MIYYLYQLKVYHPLFNLFKYISLRAALAALFSLFLSFYLTPKIAKKLKEFGFLAQIRKKWFHRLHDWKKDIPTGGGIAVLFSIFLSTLIFARPNFWIFSLLFLFLIFGFIGFLDDYLKYQRKDARGLPKKIKLPLELLISSLFGLWIFSLKNPSLTLVSLPFFKNFLIQFGPFYILWTALVIFLTSNAVNLTDGLDGLAISSLVFVGLGYGILSYLAGNAILAKYLYIPFVEGVGEVAIFCAALVASSLGFLWYNAYPSSIFLGDVGALSLGAAIGYIALISKQELILPLIGGIFLIEGLSVFLQVVSFRWKRKRIFKMTPLHHHFELKNWPEPKIVARFQIISVILLILGLITLKLR